MPKTFGALGEEMTALLSEIVNGGDDKLKADPNTFVSWCMPGLPFEARDFEFCAKGFGGGATAEEEKSLLRQAFAFSTLVDFVPDSSRAYTDAQQDVVWRTSEARMSHMYGEILRLSRVADSEMTAETQAELDRLRGLLRTTRKDLASGQDVLIDSPEVQAYNLNMSTFIAARTAYNNKRIAASAATGPEGKAAVADFSLNGDLYAMQAGNALKQWEAVGYKNDIEGTYAKINDITGRSAKIWKQKLIDALGEAKVKALGPGQDFYYTTLIPGEFAASQGWQQYSSTHDSTTEVAKSSTMSWKAKAAGSWALMGVGGSGSGGGSKTVTGESSTFERCKISFEFTQLVIARPYFFPEFFQHRGWTLNPGQGWFFDKLPSDGGAPPAGCFVAYPTSVLMARNIVIESEEIAKQVDTMSKQIDAGGTLSYGLFSLGGSYSKGETSRNFRAENDLKSIRVPGMQIIGFINRMVGKAPNPLPDLKPADFK